MINLRTLLAWKIQRRVWKAQRRPSERSDLEPHHYWLPLLPPLYSILMRHGCCIRLRIGWRQAISNIHWLGRRRIGLWLLWRSRKLPLFVLCAATYRRWVLNDHKSRIANEGQGNCSSNSETRSVRHDMSSRRWRCWLQTNQKDFKSSHRVLHPWVKRSVPNLKAAILNSFYNCLQKILAGPSVGNLAAKHTKEGKTKLTKFVNNIDDW